MNIKSWQDVLLEVVETDPADFSDRKNICISTEDLGNILRSALEERDKEIEAARRTSEYWKAEHLAGNAVIAAQRRVLEQAYLALRHLHHNAFKSGADMGLALTVASTAVTAIQEQLNVSK